MGEDRELPFLGMPAESDWVLRAGSYDHTLMRDALGFWLFSDIWGRHASRFRFVEVYLDGEYEGVKENGHLSRPVQVQLCCCVAGLVLPPEGLLHAVRTQQLCGLLDRLLAALLVFDQHRHLVDLAFSVE